MGKAIVLFSGIVFITLGLLSGILLILTPLGMREAVPDLTVWVFFPVLTTIGYLFLAGAASLDAVALISRIAGALLLCLALAAIVALFLIGAAVIATSANTLGLWYVFGFGFVFGSAGLSFTRFMPRA